MKQLLPILIFIVLLILGARAHPLWGDEAETALFARNILKYGIPRGFDGVNLMGHEDAVALNRNLVDYSNPWPQYYLTALSFKIFGESSFSARLPFILISIFSIPLISFISLKLTSSKAISSLIPLALSLNIPFILFSFQSRYYPLTIFAGLLMALSSLSITNNRKSRLIFLFSGAFFLYSHYVSFFVFYVSLMLAVFLYNKCHCEERSGEAIPVQSKKHSSNSKFLSVYLILGLLSFLLYLPYLILLRPLDRGGITIPPLNELIPSFTAFITFLYQNFNESNALPLLFLPLIILILLRYRKNGLSPAFLFFLSLSFTYFIIITLISLFTMEKSDNLLIFPRYNTILFPFLIALSVITLKIIFNKNHKIFLIFLFLYIFTNIFTLTKPRIFLLDFAKEIIFSYLSPDEEVAKYLKAHASNRDTAFVSLDRAHDPLVFYLDSKIRFVNRVNPLNPRIFPQNYKTLPDYLYNFKGKPDWIILYGTINRQDPFDYAAYDFRDYRSLGDINLKKDYEETILPVYFLDASRPEIAWHSFEKISPPKGQEVYIYRLKSP